MKPNIISETMQELPGTTTTHCNPEQQAGAETNASVVEQNQTKVTENDSTITTNGNVKEKAPPKKKRANPVYITPVRRERKRSCSDSDDEGYIPRGDSDWGTKKKSKGKKKAKSGKAKSANL